MLHSTNQSKPCLPPPPRTLRIWLDIRDDRGETTYKVFPRKPTPAYAGSVRLIKVDDFNGENLEVSDLDLTAAGALTCTCPGFKQHQHCKHCDAMTAAKVFLPEERRLLVEIGRELASLKDEAQAKVAELNWQLSAARRDLEAAQAEITSLQTELASRPARSARKTQSLRRSHKQTLAAVAAEEKGVA